MSQRAQVSDELLGNYTDYYKSGPSQWRDIGAAAKLTNILELTERETCSTILEVGCGDGAILQKLSENDFGEKLHGLEISATGVEATKKRKIRTLSDVKVFDGYTIPYADKSMDLVILCHVLEHAEHPRMLLKEVLRVGKQVYLEVPLDLNRGLQFPDRRKSTLDKEKPLGHINVYNPRSIRHLINSMDATIDEESVTNPPLAAYRYRGGIKGTIKFLVKEVILRIASKLATNLFTYHYSALCRTTN